MNLRSFTLLPLLFSTLRSSAPTCRSNMSSCTSTSAGKSEAVDLIVVGGGISGMVVAEISVSNGLTVKVLEARQRVGGRLLSFEGIDLGGSWSFPPHETEGLKLAARLGVPVVDQRVDGSAFVARQGTKIQNVGNQGGRMAPCGPSSVRFQGGYSELARHLSNKIVASELSDVLLGTHVTSVEYIEATKLVRITATSNDSGKEQEGESSPTHYHAKRVVFALPPSVLARSVSFKPALPKAQLRKMAETATWCGDWCKIAAVFQTPFWRDSGASGVVSTEGELISIWYEGGSGLEGEAAAITGLGFGVEACTELQRTLLDGEDSVALQNYVVSMLGPAFGENKVRKQLVKVRGKAWAVDELTYSGGAKRREYGHSLLRQPTEWGVHFAGSETENNNGHVEGAIISGIRAAKEVLTSMK